MSRICISQWHIWAILISEKENWNQLCLVRAVRLTCESILSRDLEGVRQSKSSRGCSYWGELAWLGGLARLGEMVFIPRSYGIFYLSSIKKFVKKIDQINSDVTPSCRTNVLILFNYLKSKTKLLKETLSHLAGLAHLRVFIWKIFISPRWDPGKIKWDPTIPLTILIKMWCESMN